MNQTERRALDWLMKQGKGEIVHQHRELPDFIRELVVQSQGSPDFIDENGKGYEAKLLRENTITFTEGQLEKLLKFAGGVTVLVMDKDKPEPVAHFSAKD